MPNMGLPTQNTNYLLSPEFKQQMPGYTLFPSMVGAGSTNPTVGGYDQNTMKYYDFSTNAQGQVQGMPTWNGQYWNGSYAQPWNPADPNGQQNYMMSGINQMYKNNGWQASSTPMTSTWGNAPVTSQMSTNPNGGTANASLLAPATTNADRTRTAPTQQIQQPAQSLQYTYDGANQTGRMDIPPYDPWSGASEQQWNDWWKWVNGGGGGYPANPSGPSPGGQWTGPDSGGAGGSGGSGGGTRNIGGSTYVGPGQTVNNPYYNQQTGQGSGGNSFTGSGTNGQSNAAAGFTPYYYNQGGGMYNQQSNSFWQDPQGNWWTGDKSGSTSSISAPPWGQSQGTNYLTGSMASYVPMMQQYANWEQGALPYWQSAQQNVLDLSQGTRNQFAGSNASQGTMNDWLSNVYKNGIPGQNAVGSAVSPAVGNYGSLYNGANGRAGLVDSLQNIMTNGLPGQGDVTNSIGSSLGNYNTLMNGTGQAGNAGLTGILNQIYNRGLEGQSNQESLSKSLATQAQQGGITPEIAAAYRRTMLQPAQQALQSQVNQMGGGIASVPTIDDQGQLTSVGSGSLAELMRRNQSEFNDRLLTKGFENQAQLANTSSNVYGNTSAAVSPYFQLGGNLGLGTLNAGNNAFQGVASAASPYYNMAGQYGLGSLTGGTNAMSQISSATSPWANMLSDQATNQYNRGIQGMTTASTINQVPYNMQLSAAQGMGNLAQGMYGTDIGAATSRYGSDIGLQGSMYGNDIQQAIALAQMQNQRDIANAVGQGSGWAQLLPGLVQMGTSALNTYNSGQSGGYNPYAYNSGSYNPWQPYNGGYSGGTTWRV